MGFNSAFKGLIWMKESDQIDAQATLTSEKELLVSIEQEAGWTTGFLGEETESLALP
jgi:hypothetical protein